MGAGFGCLGCWLGSEMSCMSHGEACDCEVQSAMRI